MKAVLGLLLILVGAAAGLYVGVWLCFVGGIVDIINAIKAEDTVALDVALGVIKIVFAGLFGWIAGVIPALLGLGLIQSD